MQQTKFCIHSRFRTQSPEALRRAVTKKIEKILVTKQKSMLPERSCDYAKGRNLLPPVHRGSE